MRIITNNNKTELSLRKFGTALILMLMLTGCSGGGGNDEATEKSVTTISGKA